MDFDSFGTLNWYVCLGAHSGRDDVEVGKSAVEIDTLGRSDLTSDAPLIYSGMSTTLQQYSYSSMAEEIRS